MKNLAVVGRVIETADIPNADRIIQARLVQTPRVAFETVEQLTLTERGAGGFGSTDKVAA